MAYNASVFCLPPKYIHDSKYPCQSHVSAGRGPWRIINKRGAYTESISIGPELPALA